ncbi:hypothetical protein HPP92_007982, partial [Vanilla planifolia]
MSFDGSFTCEVALSRFLSRCPELRSNAKLVALLQKGRALSSFDLVAAIADPFLHPSYTIPVVGCFRALCGQVVQSALAKLFVVRGLMLESEENGEDIGEEDMHVVDFYAGRHRGLKLHELACLAFCRAVDLAPFLLQYVLIYFQSSPPPFRRLMLTGTFVQLTHEIVFATLNVVRISYRLLLLDPKVFSKLWDWSVFLELLKQISSIMESSGPWLDSLLDIRWCGIQILSIVFCASDSAVVNFGMREEEAFTCLLRWKEFCEDTAVEKAGWYLQGTEMIKGTCLDDAVDLCHIKPFDCSSLSNSICGGSEKISQKKILCEHKQLEGNFVLTTTLKRSFEMVVMAVIQRWPVLLFGPAGCGKTALINHLALKSGNRVLFIHMDEQMDSKSLIGSYVSSEHPGEFRWQPGSLMQALVGGLWVVFEDIDKAPNEIQSIILPLLEGSSSFVTVHGEMADVSESFRLFGTVSTSRTELNHSEGRFSYSILWRKVMVQAPTRDDLIDIINARFLKLDQLSTQLVETFERVNSFSQQMRGLSASAFDRFSIRDLLKWCNRITGSSFNLSGLGLSAYDRQNIYQEAVDIFVSCLHMLENRLLLKREIANLLNISCAAETVLYPSNKPTIQMLSSGLQIGRTLLCCKRNIFCQNRTFVSIRSALYALERIACSVRYNEPVLLVGETGTGKTTLVQYLAARLGRPLTVLNLSQQSDVADLLGGFKPADARSICMPLYHEFKKLFCKTFSEKDNEALLRHCEEYILEKKWKKLLRAFQKSVHFAQKNVGKIIESGTGSKRKRPLSEKLLQKWESFSLHLDCVSKKIDVSSGISFKFVEGAFVTALRTGQWLLLDEVNLAPLETLQRIISVLDGEHGTLCLAERGDVNYVERHPQFRLFACMNPATDAGKRDLPFSFRSRFSEYFIDDVLDDEDLNLYVNQYMGEGNATVELCNKIVRFYKAAKRESEERLQDSANQKPQYSLRYPVLLQGPTSSGKTSLVQYLASVTGHEFVRINNHEHTDLQEYFGTYITDSHGKLQFQEGVLVKAVRKGYWIILDELNLAPSDVLEALNRLLDDNRELFVPELQETIPAHPDFMLFATQNPPIAYGGRKILSRAFRNRFLEIHVDEIPEDELTTILENRCSIPASYASKMIKVMKDLQLHRQNSRAFAGKHGFITPRDLFRWANRFRAFGKSYYDLAKDGYFLLAERLREEREKNVVREALNCHLNVKLAVDELYDVGQCEVDAVLMSSGKTKVENLGSITWTKSMLRLYFLVERCYRMREPVLLVGGVPSYTRTTNFSFGIQTPYRKDEGIKTFPANISSDISQASSTLCHLNKIEASYKQCSALYPDVTPIDFEIFKKMKLELIQLQQKWQTVFVWQDGPLVEAMKAGDIFLVDEISLADDSVLERLNSVLEPERMLLLAEKGGSSPEKVIAHHNFFVVATMNPGGDYGKKELSPALRNRFTEIWVEPVSDIEELRCIALEKLSKPNLSFLVNCILEFWKWFSKFETRRMLTVRDLLSWISFVNLTEESLGSEYALLHGAFLVLLDGISLGTGISKSDSQLLRNASLEFLIKELKASGCGLSTTNLHEMEIYGWGDYVKHEDIIMANGTPSEHLFGIDPFFIDKGNEECKHGGFEFLAPTTRRNVMRVLRAMQLPKPILLEGSPGVGKTSLVVALAQQSGHTVVRINLSEQTDMMDLLGSDLPVEGSNGMEFCWSDGILLQALKNGSWVLLDELNLAPQAVLEGLNAILDHRAEVYIPELGLTFKCPPSFRVFACQNPSSQGGGRKGLPKSFLNRFTKVHVDELAADDYLFICQSRFPSISSSVLSKLIAFVGRLDEDIMVRRKYGQDGAPWVFNLRDVIRSCEIIQGASMNAKLDCFLNVIFLQRMRSYTDRKEVMRLYEEVFDMKPSIVQFPEVYVNPKYVVVGSVCVQRNHFQPTKAFRSQLNLLPGLLQILKLSLFVSWRQWLCVLVGPAASGKTSVIRLLAELTGNVLNELNLSSGTDVSELLGCFEQYSSFRNFKVAISQIERFVDEYFSLRLEINWKDFIEERRDLFSKWFSFFSSCDVSKSSSLFSTSWMGDGICSSFLDPLVEIIEQLKHDVKRFSLPVSWTLKELDGSLKIIHALQKNWQIRSSASFEWVPGNLVKSIEFGEWIVLDNANLCNPTVLDRINSLVEPDGSIMINECGMVDGKPLLMKSHPNFRMFITVDPRYGEISRAMRNRGVEIFMLQPDSFAGEVTEHENIEVVNLKTYLIQSGIPSEKMVLAMCGAHMSARAVGTSLGVRITLLEIARWVQLFQQLIMNGNDPIWSLHLSWEHTYLAALGEPRGRDDDARLDSIVSANADLRHLATEGLSMSTYIIARSNHCHTQLVHQLDEIFLRLLRKFEHDKRCLEPNFSLSQNLKAPVWHSKNGCCIFSLEMLCHASFFDCLSEVLPLFNRRCLNVDVKLILMLSKLTLLDASEAHKILHNFNGPILHVLDYSLENSSRSPTDFSPHQTILWIFDAYNSLDSVGHRLSSLILEMWYGWNSSLWNFFSDIVKVRGESGLLAGKFNAPEDDRLKVLKEQLEKEEKLAQTKVVFRPEHSKYEMLKSAFAYVFDLVASCTSLLNNARCSTDIDIMIEMAKTGRSNKVTAESFINKLSDEFVDYVDLVQPVQVAVYEMKLGLSLVISWIIERQHLKKTGKLEMILAPVFLIMQFPKVLSIKSIYDNNSVGTKIEVLSSGHERVEFLDISLLNSLIAMSDEIRPAQISHVQLQITLCYIVFIHLAYNIFNSLVMEKASFLLLNEVFGHFSRLWMDVQSQARAHEEGKAQYYEFRPRSVVLDDIVEGIITSLDLSDSEVHLSTEGQELLMEREFATVNEPLKEAGNIEEDRTFIPESILRCLVRVHNSMFGSGSFLEHPNVCIVTKEDRLLLFVESYKLGTMLMEGLQRSTSSAMDDNILPEHLLHVCLEYESFGAKASHPCNIYKESDPEIMFRMVKPLIAIQNKVAAMLEEWPDHPGLKKINDATEALLKISPCTPLSKALLGLQLLVCKVQFIQENDSRFSLKDELQPICSILSSWQKFEVDSWPSLLDDVCEQYEINAGKLWFPLQAVIRRNFSGDKDAENILTIQ